MLSIWFATNYFYWRFFIFIPIVLFSDSLIRYNLFGFIENDLISIIISILLNSVYLLLLIRINKLYLSNLNAAFDRTNLKKLLINNSRDFYQNLLETLEKKNNIHSFKVKDEYRKRLTFTRNILSDRLVASSDKRPSVNLLTERIVVGILILLPFIFNVHRLIPSGTTTLDLYFIEIGTFDFADIDTMIWLVMLNLVYILPLFIWFITCPYWWRYAILAPIILSTFQLWELFFEINIYEWRNLKTVPYLLIVLSLLIYASEKVKYEVKLSKILIELDNELSELINFLSEDSIISNVRNKLSSIRAKDNTGDKDKLEELIRLRERIIAELQDKEEK